MEGKFCYFSVALLNEDSIGVYRTCRRFTSTLFFSSFFSGLKVKESTHLFVKISPVHSRGVVIKKTIKNYRKSTSIINWKHQAVGNILKIYPNIY